MCCPSICIVKTQIQSGQISIFSPTYAQLAGFCHLLKPEKWIWVVVLWFKKITAFWAAKYGRDHCTTGYRKTANHRLVIKMHTVRGSTAPEMVKILKTESHSLQLREENNAWNFDKSWKKICAVMKCIFWMMDCFCDAFRPVSLQNAVCFELSVTQPSYPDWLWTMLI